MRTDALSKAMALAIEDIANGKAAIETESTIYAHIEDFAQLANATEREFQEQWGIRVPKTDMNYARGDIRIRNSVYPDGRSEHVLTIKVKGKSDGSDATRNLEVSVPTSDHQFEVMKMLADKGMRKVRFTFPVQGFPTLKWEVDLFVKEDVHLTPEQILATAASGDVSVFHDWCKIDLENPPAELPPLPMTFSRVITAPYGQRTQEEEAVVTLLYSGEFVTPNRYTASAM